MIRRSLLYIILPMFSMVTYAAPWNICYKNLDAYVGTWQYTSDTLTFKITLKKVPMTSTFANGECLLGDYYLKKYDTLISSIGNIPDASSDETLEQEMLYGTNAVLITDTEFENLCEHIDSTQIRVRAYDKTYQKRIYEWRIDLLSPTKIRWWRDGVPEGIYMEDEMKKAWETSLPDNITLTKVIKTPYIRPDKTK